MPKCYKNNFSIGIPVENHETDWTKKTKKNDKETEKKKTRRLMENS